MESVRTARNPCGVRMESVRTARSPCGVHKDTWGRVNYWRERESKKRKLTISDEQVDEGLNVDVEEKMLSHD